MDDYVSTVTSLVPDHAQTLPPMSSQQRSISTSRLPLTQTRTLPPQHSSQSLSTKSRRLDQQMSAPPASMNKLHHRFRGLFGLNVEDGQMLAHDVKFVIHSFVHISLQFTAICGRYISGNATVTSITKT